MKKSSQNKRGPSLILPVPVLAALEDARIHLVTDEEIGLRKAPDHGVIEIGLIIGPGDFFFRGDEIILGESA